MNSKIAKALRREMRSRNIDPRDTHYEPELMGKRTYPDIQLPMIGAIKWCTVPLVWGMYTLKLVPTCGRKLYKVAKKLLDNRVPSVLHSDGTNDERVSTREE